MLYELIEIDFAPLAGLLFLLLFIVSNKKAEENIRKIFIVLCILEFIELFAYTGELWMASLDKPTYWRVFFNAVAYSIRPFMLLCIFRIAARDHISKISMMIFIIPAVLNVLVSFSAFFTDIAYSYNEANEIVRGALGYVPHIVVVLYLIHLPFLSVRRDKGKSFMEEVIIWLMSFVIALSLILCVVLPVKNIDRMAIVLSTIAYYMYFQSRTYRENLSAYMKQTIISQKEHLWEMNIIGVLANEYVTVCYVDVEKDEVIPYRMDPYIEANYGEVMRSRISFEQIFKSYVTRDIYEEDRAFFLDLADLQQMLEYLRENGGLSRKYRVLRDGQMLYCEMRVELVNGKNGVQDMVFGFSNDDMRIRKEMVYQSTVQQELHKVEEAKNSLAGIADLARQLQEAIEDKLSTL